MTYTDNKGKALRASCDVARCSSCQTIKPKDAFHADRSRSTGVTSRCKVCSHVRDVERQKVLRRLKDDLRPLIDSNPDYRRYIRAAAAELAA